MRMAISALALSCAMLASACNKLPGKPPPGPEVPRPDSVLSSQVLYAQYCAGCHGADGLHGPASPLASPVYQAWVDDATLHRVIAQGEPGSLMPAFAKSSGGDLTDAQVDAIVRGMRADWNTGNVLAGETPPPYAEDGKGDSLAGEHVYASSCAKCHGPAGGKIGKAGSVLNADFLALMTPQSLRTAVVVGRPDLGMPDWRKLGNGEPLTAKQVSDIVAFLVAQQPNQKSRASHATSGRSNDGETAAARKASGRAR